MTTAFRLRLRNAPALRVDLAGLAPLALAGADPAELSRRTVPHGRETLALGELFDITALPGDAPALRFEGDLGRCDGIGRGMEGGTIVVEGPAGDYLGAEMRGGELLVAGNAGQLVGCAMAGGKLEVGGDVADFAASALPGDMDGMRGGTLIVRGNAGARCADRMRRGTVVVFGDCGEFLASRLVAGTLAVAGATGPHCGYGMRRGSLVFAGPAPDIPPTFAATHHDIRVFWALLCRHLARFGGPFAGLAARAPRRYAGDLAVDGRGEWLLPG